MPTPHRVVIGVFPGVDLLDVAGPAEVFALANRAGGGRADYGVRLAAPEAGAVRTSAGVRLVPDLTFDEVGGQVETLLVPGAVDMTDDGPVARIDQDIVAWVKETARHARRVASVCVGAHLLAAPGLLDGRTATTHWSTAAQLAAAHPEVTVDADPIFVRADRGRVWTGAGISACLDLALALVAEDRGEDVAPAVARQLVMYLKRQGGQSQFSVPSAGPPPCVPTAARHDPRRLPPPLPHRAGLTRSLPPSPATSSRPRGVDSSALPASPRKAHHEHRHPPAVPDAARGHGRGNPAAPAERVRPDPHRRPEHLPHRRHGPGGRRGGRRRLCPPAGTGQGRRHPRHPRRPRRR